MTLGDCRLYRWRLERTFHAWVEMHRQERNDRQMDNQVTWPQDGVCVLSICCVPTDSFLCAIALLDGRQFRSPCVRRPLFVVHFVWESQSVVLVFAPLLLAHGPTPAMLVPVPTRMPMPMCLQGPCNAHGNVCAFANASANPLRMAMPWLRSSPHSQV